MKIEIKNRWNGNVIFTHDAASEVRSVALRVAIVAALSSGANLRGANLRGANLRGAKNIPSLVCAQTLITAEGDIIGYRKLSGGTITKLKIPADAKRHNATGRKCRAEYAIVLDGEGVSQYDNEFVYKVGETVRPKNGFNPNRWNECAGGIHFFLTREEAEDY